MKEIICNGIKKQKIFLHGIEIGLALVVVIGVFYAFINQVPRLLELDWSLTSTFIEFLEVILFLVIGVELARILVSYSINAVIELFIFVLVRKILLFQESITYLSVVILSLILLFMVNYYINLKNDNRDIK